MIHFPIWAAATPAFNPAALSLTGWWRPNYSGSPWTRVASAGTSGDSNKDLITVGTAPSNGAALNGYTPPDFNGSTQALSTSGAFAESVLPISGWEAVILFHADTGPGAAVNLYDNVAFMESVGGPGLIWSSSGIGIVHHDAPNGWIGGWHAVSNPTTEDHLGWFKYDGAAHTIACAVDGGAYTTIASAQDSDRALANYGLTFGKSIISATSYFNGRMYEIMTAAAFTAGQRTDIISYFNGKYAKSF